MDESWKENGRTISSWGSSRLNKQINYGVYKMRKILTISAIALSLTTDLFAMRNNPQYAAGSYSQPNTRATTAVATAASRVQRINYSGGIVYEGGFVGGKPHGRGIMTWPDGKKYDGQWLNGKKHGQGTMYWPDSMFNDATKKHEGLWANDLPNGQGRRTYMDGTVDTGIWTNGVLHQDILIAGEGFYKGEWRHGQQNGQGRIDYDDGRVYVGNFKDGKPHGRGTMAWPDSTSPDAPKKHEGLWANGLPNGQGRRTYMDGVVDEGIWTNGVLKKTVSFPDHSQYQGEWRHGRANGQGICIYSSGDRYEGQFLDSKRHGHGKYTTFSTGQVWEGEWANDQFIGR